jgi:hypothetical protein
MKIVVMTKWYNEEDLAPFFLWHYEWADEVLILLDRATTDASAEIAGMFPQVTIEYCGMPDGLLHDDYLVDLVNKRIRDIKADWVISVDADEFIFSPLPDNRKFISRADGNLIYAHFWHVWRHWTDGDLDANHPPLYQRRHGDPNRTIGYNGTYYKPIIVKPETGIIWEAGQHRFEKNSAIKISNSYFNGAHWSMADPELAIRRRIAGRRDRFSEINKKNHWGYQWFDITEEKIRAECEKHSRDPRLF